jgi:hypothetical protein
MHKQGLDTFANCQQFDALINGRVLAALRQQRLPVRPDYVRRKEHEKDLGYHYEW